MSKVKVELRSDYIAESHDGLNPGITSKGVEVDFLSFDIKDGDYEPVYVVRQRKTVVIPWSYFEIEEVKSE